MAGTYKDIQRMTGLSLSTISKYFNGLPVRKQNASAIEAAAKKIDFRVNSLAQSLRTRKSMTIGVLLPDLSNSFHSMMVARLADLIMPKGYGVIVGTYSNDLARLDEAVQFLLDKQVDGLVMVHGGDNGWPKCLDGREASLPIVVLDRVDGHQTDAVLVDNEAAGREAAQILVDHGHQHVAMIGGPSDISSLRGRRDGFVAGLKEAGIDLPSGALSQSALTVEAGQDALLQLMDRSPRPTALFAANGELTAGAVIGLHKLGLKIGKDVSLVGFDDELLAQAVAPRLTVVLQPTKELASSAADLLLRRINQPDALPMKIELPCSLFEGNSVATLPGADTSASDS